MWNSAGRAPSLRVLPWYLPYIWGKSTEKPQSGFLLHSHMEICIEFHPNPSSGGWQCCQQSEANTETYCVGIRTVQRIVDSSSFADFSFISVCSTCNAQCPCWMTPSQAPAVRYIEHPVYKYLDACPLSASRQYLSRNLNFKYTQTSRLSLCGKRVMYVQRSQTRNLVSCNSLLFDTSRRNVNYVETSDVKHWQLHHNFILLENTQFKSNKDQPFTGEPVS